MKLVEGIKNKRKIITILGIRRIGKSSLVKVALNTGKNPYIYMDLRQAYTMEGYLSSYTITSILEDSLNKLLRTNRLTSLIDYLRNVKSIKITSIGIELEKQPKRIQHNITSIMESLDEWAQDNKSVVALVFDEAQYLRYSRLNFRAILAYIYDNLSNISIILTGSEVGLLHDLLRIDDPSSELYGRYIYEIELKPLTREQSIDFLEKGFKEYNIVPPKDLIIKAVDRLDGIIGWLVFFGRLCIDRGVNEQSLHEVFRKGVNLVKIELQELYKRSRRYKYVLEAIARNNNTWSNIKKYLMAIELKPINDSALYEILKGLQKMGIVEKTYDKKTGNIVYKIVDPMIAYAVREGL